MKPKFRHRVVFDLLRIGFPCYLKRKFNYRYEKYNGDVKPPYLIISNHTHNFDPFMLALSFKMPIYFVASDELLKKNATGKMISYLASPIPKTKSKSDIRTAMSVVSMIRNKGSVGVFIEGNRGYFGKSVQIPYSISKLIKLANIPVVFYELSKTYFSQPRWSKYPKKGDCRGFVKSVWMPEEYSTKTDDEIYDYVCKNIVYNEYDTDEELCFKGKNRAEYLETAIYVCPVCHSISSMRSANNEIYCTNCASRAEYGEDCKLHGDFPETLIEVDQVQKNFILNNDFKNNIDIPIACDSGIKLYQKYTADRSDYMDEGTISIFRDRIEIDGDKKTTLMFSEIVNMAIQYRNSLLIYTKDTTYFVKPPERFCALKYVNLYEKFEKNILDANGFQL